MGTIGADKEGHPKHEVGEESGEGDRFVDSQHGEVLVSHRQCQRHCR